MKNTNLIYSNKRFQSQRQTGAVLIIGLILLFSLTLLGVGAMSTNLMQQRMATNMGDATLAFNASDTLIRREQKWLRSQPDEAVLLKADCDNNTQCIYFAGQDKKNILVTTYNEEWWNSAAVLTQAWWDANAYEYCCDPIPSDLDNVLLDPRIVIERQQYEQDSLDLGTTSYPTGVTYYRLTARGTGSTNLSEAVIQATVSKRWN
ncbi:MAG: PilX N-terminal domain-containing pilus assembly protein [Gammaproteobacteria bacterium]